MSDYNVNQMDIKRLRNEVQMLRDELAIMQRKYEDILYNLDDDNFSSQLKKEKDGMKASIKITEKQIETKVSKDELESTISQTANEIKSTVNDFKNDLSSKITQTASGISSRVDKIEGGEFDGYTLFEQYYDKFKFTGNVEISGDAVVGGDIKGSKLSNSSGTHSLKMIDDVGHGYGTFCLYNARYGDVPYFSIYDNTLGGIGLICAGTGTFLSVKRNGDTTTVQPEGCWNFNDASVINIHPKFA